MTNHRKRFW